MKLKVLIVITYTFLNISCKENHQSKEVYKLENEGMKVTGWYEPKDPTPKEQCPCCDYISLPERRTYLICPVCFWEDDGQDIDRLDDESGPNRMTLREGRNNFKKLGACDVSMVKNVIPVNERKHFKYKPRDL